MPLKNMTRSLCAIGYNFSSFLWAPRGVKITPFPLLGPLPPPDRLARVPRECCADAPPLTFASPLPYDNQGPVWMVR
jgi:hypothetical protein